MSYNEKKLTELALKIAPYLKKGNTAAVTPIEIQIELDDAKMQKTSFSNLLDHFEKAGQQKLKTIPLLVLDEVERAKSPLKSKLL